MHEPIDLSSESLLFITAPFTSRCHLARLCNLLPSGVTASLYTHRSASTERNPAAAPTAEAFSAVAPE